MTSTMMPDSSSVRALLRQVGMQVPDNRITPVSGGTINTAFRIDAGDDGPFIMRISPTDAEAEAGPGWMTSHGLRREQTTIGMLPHIAHMMPHTVHFDESRDHIDRDWVLQTWMGGKAWQEARPGLSGQEDLELRRELGRLIREIHTVTGEEFGPPEIGMGHSTWSDLIRWDVTGFSVDAHRFGIEQAPFDQLQSLVDDAAQVLDQITEPRLVHSDLNERHIFIAPGPDGNHHVTGLIDFEFARFADPRSETIFIPDPLLPADDERDVALCEGYECEKPSHDDLFRQHVYTLITMGWTVMDLVRREQLNQVPAFLSRMQSLTTDARELL